MVEGEIRFTMRLLKLLSLEPISDVFNKFPYKCPICESRSFDGRCIHCEYDYEMKKSCTPEMIAFYEKEIKEWVL